MLHLIRAQGPGLVSAMTTVVICLVSAAGTQPQGVTSPHDQLVFHEFSDATPKQELAVPQELPDELPSADEVIEKYMEAIGGEMALSSIESMSLEAEFDGQGNRGNGKVRLDYRNGCWRYIFDLEDGLFGYLQSADGTAWEQPDSWYQMSEKDKVKFREIVPVVNSALQWQEYEGTIQTTAILPIEERLCVEVTFHPKGGDPVQRYFDRETGLLVRMRYQTGSRAAEWILSEYQDFEGFLIPTKRWQYFDGAPSYVVKTKKVELNPEIDEKLFEPPVREPDNVDRISIGRGSRRVLF